VPLQPPVKFAARVPVSVIVGIYCHNLPPYV
jgi:hypothetical protein